MVFSVFDLGSRLLAKPATGVGPATVAGRPSVRTWRRETCDITVMAPLSPFKPSPRLLAKLATGVEPATVAGRPSVRTWRRETCDITVMAPLSPFKPGFRLLAKPATTDIAVGNHRHLPGQK